MRCITYTTVTKVIYRYSNFFPVDKSKFNASAHIYITTNTCKNALQFIPM